MFTKEEYESGDAVAISWHIDDVKDLYWTRYEKEMTDDEAREILANFAHNHDGSMTAMWDDLQFHVDNFEEEK